MRLTLGVAVLVIVVLSSTAAIAQERTVTIVVRGETNLTTNFVEDLKGEAKGLRLRFDIVERQRPHDYVVILAQESSLGGAAAAVIALDGDENVVASVVRSGRLSGRGAMNACTKELAKKIAVLKK